MNNYAKNKTNLGWFLCLDADRIVGDVGVIENDFLGRKDLAPNICAVYVEEEYRNHGIAERLLNLAVDDLKMNGISPVYLITDHVGFYEQYGFTFLTKTKCVMELLAKSTFINKCSVKNKFHFNFTFELV